ncbi:MULTISPECIES: amino acid ABC transporter permease [Rhizobium]|uniref:Amino acid ABC transporter permease n=1 Tax=Rhizobium rhododendri TaxID=2506430 RepID=A0ABY8IFC3_9HYPH|nr:MULTISPECIES: amino acid ABC transporter permease [Rhizobium]MBZ5760882.1 amino acid ABC transporter permease [Rhizobium sp. VS19-DR96]MBZ5765334.1 amino acid ABC transporter permease [Rhizobium sp. VS19-DR129.2]MBZ5774703.1 amino acid ABC transporter permease [Rhizobium sp. VS19-DRK62.2]MBZ5784717.1 amino acid ABC transporter permease [Rhizobium sp. VS19-DR121]MBZ5801329.1 amino acid ABC transporter permease [Rhizobium sp. VS19-DR181]
MTFDIHVIIDQWPAIVSGGLVTILIWILGTVAAAFLGFLVAVARRYGGPVVDAIFGLLVAILRGTPFLIQIFLVYYGGPFIGLSLDPIPAGLMGLSIYGAAYYSEIFRSGFAAVPPGHIEAGECVGMSQGQIIRRILLPEMIMLVLPPSLNMTIILMKETAVLSIITVPELTATLSAIGSQQYAFVEALFVLAVFYWVLVEATGWLGHLAETKLTRFRFFNA